VEIEGDVLEEYKQKLDVYEELVNRGVDVGAAFTDVGGHWAQDSIKKLSAIGLFNGYGDNTFRPDSNVTLAEAVTLVMKLAEAGQAAEEWDVDEEGLATVPDWAREAAYKAAKRGWINLHRFHSHVQASRAEVAVMIAKSLGLEPVNVNETPFADGVLIAPEDVGYIMALYEQGIIKGTADGKFNPNSAITRAEMAALIERLIALQEEPQDAGEEEAVDEDYVEPPAVGEKNEEQGETEATDQQL